MANEGAAPTGIDGSAVSAAMDRYAQGDDRAFAEVYSGLAPRLLPFLRRRAPSDALAEELLQQTFLQMHTSREHYATGFDVVPWAFAIARRLLIDAYRKAGREVHGDFMEPASAEPGPDEALALKEAVSSFAGKLGALPPNQREVFELVKFEGMSLAQAAQTLGVTLTAVKLRLHRAYETLRDDGREPLREAR